MVNLLRWLSLACVVVLGGVSFGDELILCGGDEVFIVDVTADGGAGPPRVVWRWRAKDRPELPEALRSRFNSTDECKPVEGGKRVLVTSSGGGVALVDRQSGKAVWHAYVANAHSADLLPGGRVAVAGSTHDKGNRLVLFDVKRPNEPLWRDALHSGHGVVWDEERRALWALGYDELRRYRLHMWDSPTPSLRRDKTFKLPSDGGHDLSPMPDGDGLIVSTHHHVYRFDRANGQFRPYAPLADVHHVKGVSFHPKTDRVAYVHGEDGNWWSPRVRFLKPDGEIVLKGRRLYKARWWRP